MGNPDENIKHAIRHFDMNAAEEARAYKVGGVLAAILLGGMALAVIAAVLLLVLAVV